MSEADVDNSKVLQSKLASVTRGARAFMVIQLVFMVIGILFGVISGLRLLSAGSFEGWADAAQTASSSVGYLFIAWLAGRASDAFEAIVALIREMSEIV